MSTKTFRPFTSTRRFTILVTPTGEVNPKSVGSLMRILPKKSGRSHGKMTVRHQGGREKRFYRVIDFKRDKRDIIGRVLSLEYDPNRSCLIALINYVDGEKRYILAPQGLRVGDTVEAGEKAEIKTGDSLPLRSMPLGTIIHNIELVPGAGGQIVRSAGSLAVLMAKEGGYVHIKLPSGEVRKVLETSYATVGQVSNPEHSAIKYGKAGRIRHLGIRPTVRGTAMPAGVHPHGGGEGRTGPGRPTKTIYGKGARGHTRKRNKKSNILILEKRK